MTPAAIPTPDASLLTRYRAALEWALDHAGEEHPYYPCRSARTEDEWVYPYLVNGDGGFGSGKGEAVFFNALDAVEAAMGEKPSEPPSAFALAHMILGDCTDCTPAAWIEAASALVAKAGAGITPAAVAHTAGFAEGLETAAAVCENLAFFTPVAELAGMSKQEMSVRTCHEAAAAIRNLIAGGK